MIHCNYNYLQFTEFVFFFSSTQIQREKAMQHKSLMTLNYYTVFMKFK